MLRFLEAIRIPVIVTDAGRGPSGPHILYVNAEMCEMSGYARQDMVGRSPRMLQGAGTDMDRARAFRDELETEGRASVALINYGADGSAYRVLIRAGKVDLGTRLDDQLRIAFETEAA